MCHNVPPTAINTSVEFILKESIEFMTTYPHQWGMQSTLKQQNTHTHLRIKALIMLLMF